MLSLGGACVGVEEREEWALDVDETLRLYEQAQDAGVSACLLSTCYRVEVVLSGTPPEAGSEAWSEQRLVAWGRAALDRLRPGLSQAAFAETTGSAAVRHLFRIASGLESAVLGEVQILGQVRRARDLAASAGALTTEMTAVLDAAVRTGQRVRAETDLARGAASTASAAVRWADDQLGGLHGRRLVVIGAGEIGRVLMGHLATVEAASLSLVSAHAPSHAGFEVIRPDELPALLPGTDAVFAATDRVALTFEQAAVAWSDPLRRRVVADLGVPRNVEPMVSHLASVELADIDVLGAVVDAGLVARRAAVPLAEALVEGEVEAIAPALAQVQRERLIAGFRRNAERVRQETLAFTCSRCADPSCGRDEAADGAPVRPGPGRCSDPEGLTRTLTTRLLHDLTLTLRRDTDLDDETVRRLLTAHTLDASSDD